MFAGGEAEEMRSVRVCVMARRQSSESVWIDESCLLVGNELFDKPYKKVNNGGREKGRGEEKGGEGREITLHIISRRFVQYISQS